MAKNTLHKTIPLIGGVIISFVGVLMGYLFICFDSTRFFWNCLKQRVVEKLKEDNNIKYFTKEY